MQNNYSQIVENLLGDGDAHRRSEFFILSKSDLAKNQLKAKNALKDFELSDVQKIELTEMLESPHIHRSIAVFGEGSSLHTLTSLPYEYEMQFEFKLYYILPFFDYRVEFFRNCYLLVHSRNEIKLYGLSDIGIKLLDTELPESFREVLGRRWEEKSIQHHVAAESVFHGQNAANEKERETNLFDVHIAQLGSELNKILASKQGKLIIAATEDSAARIADHINKDYLAPFNLLGNFDRVNNAALLERVREEAGSKSADLFEVERGEIDISRSNELEAEDFTILVQQAAAGKVEHMWVGRLGIEDADYENPISPLGANYIAQTVLQKGGRITHYPDVDFDFSKSNLGFKFRF